MSYYLTFMFGMVVGVVIQSIKVDTHCAACAKLVHRCQCQEGPR